MSSSKDTTRTLRTGRLGLAPRITRSGGSETASRDRSSLPYLGFRVAQSLRDVDVSLQGTVAVGKGEFDVARLELGYDAYFLDDTFELRREQDAHGNEYLVEVRRGTGLQLTLEITNAKATVSADFASAAASVDAGIASAGHDFKSLGETSEEFTQELPDAGTALDLSALEKLRSGTEKALQWLATREDLGEHTEEIQTRLGKAAEADPMLVAKTVSFAMRRIERGVRLGEALTQGEALRLDGAIIRATYGYVTQDYSDSATTRPDAEARDWADRWMKTGNPLD